jgi:hypothetical protein
MNLNLSLMIVLGLSLLNGMQSPVLPVVLALISATWPLDFLPRNISWAFYQSSILISTTTLLVSGVPAAIYERLFRPAPQDQTSMYIWIAAAAVLTLPAFAVMGLI